MEEYRGAERRKLPDYVRIDVTDVTPKNAPPYAMLTFIQRNSRSVFRFKNGKMRIGRYGVYYFEDGTPSQDGIYLRREDVPPVRGPRGRMAQSGNDRRKTEG